MKYSSWIGILLMIVFSSIMMFAQNSYLNWFIHGGGPSNEVTRDVYVDNFGFIYSVSEVTDTTTFADTTFVANFADVCITKFNPQGDVLWIRLDGGTGLDRGLDIITDSNDDIIVTGFFSGIADFGDSTLVSSGFSDVFVAKYNSNGVFQWVVHGAGPDHDESFCVTVDNLNNIYFGGFFENSLQLGTYNLISTGTYETLFYSKISSNGDVLWAEQAYNLDFSESIVESICFDGFDIVMTGSFDDTMVFQGDTLYSYDESYDVFIAKVDITGNKVWIKQAGGNDDDGGRAIISDGSGKIFITGYFSQTANFGTFQLTSLLSSNDVFIAALNSNGNFIWVNQASGPSNEYPTSISYNSSNGLSICGTTTGDFIVGNLNYSGNGTEDIFAVNYSTDGNLVNVLHTGGIGEERIYDIYLDDNNSAYIVGLFYGSLVIDDSTITASTILSDLYISKINFNNISDINSDFSNVLLSDYTLYQNFPNPFNPTTKISWRSAVGNWHTLKVYDVLGNQIATLFDEYKPAGFHEVEFNPALISKNLATGIYFYQLSAGKFVETKKMLYLK